MVETAEYVQEGTEKIKNLTKELMQKGLTKKQTKSIKNTIASLDSRLKKRQEAEKYKKRISELEFLLKEVTEMIIENCDGCSCSTKIMARSNEIFMQDFPAYKRVCTHPQ